MNYKASFKAKNTVNFSMNLAPYLWSKLSRLRIFIVKITMTLKCDFRRNLCGVRICWNRI